jgi:hypothetical protein
MMAPEHPPLGSWEKVETPLSEARDGRAFDRDRGTRDGGTVWGPYKILVGLEGRGARPRGGEAREESIVS